MVAQDDVLRNWLQTIYSDDIPNDVTLNDIVGLLNNKRPRKEATIRDVLR